ncbi:hypothetical protein [Granulosicoccus antarcticus]|uniref:Sarcosine oxidase subunit gamma n=1 Tax=Granulosicoccus antarcticus IMCC3135 TaxID=1192854 RepID=A0A2Z2P088_9GAMM|nr:hypothetical protein [Granulosicoccus antarcticus]ASJ75478.1 hypothetical protein IMCC3135_27115 [Granulosicoccus antarcticus IMCC3135]
MRDDRNRWAAAPSEARPELVAQAVTARIVAIERQTVLSGDYSSCLELAGMCQPAVGSHEVANGDSYAIRQRRDRILIINGVQLEDGWHEGTGVAIADMSSAYCVIEISGTDAERIIATGTEYSAATSSPSAARLWHGFSCLIYRHENKYRLHIRSAYLEAAWDMLQQQFVLVAQLQRANAESYNP